MKMNELHGYFYSVLAALPLLLSACSESHSQGGPPPPPEVSVAAVIERQVNESDEFTGRLAAVERVEVRPRVTGYVERVYFQEGADVKKGDLLFEIDPKPFQAELARAQAELARAVTKLDLAKSDLARADKLVQSKAISQQEHDQLGSGRQDSNAAVKSAEAAVRVAQLNLDYTQIRSPINGRISRAEVTVGNLVSGGGGAPATLLTKVVSLDPIYAYFEGDEQIYLKYAELSRRGPQRGSDPGSNVIYLGLANETGHPHKGYVDFVDNELNPQTGTIRARAVFDNKERKFTPGLFARLKLVGSNTYPAVLVNDKAIGTDQSKKFVLVVGADNKAMYREVKLGPMVDGLRVVHQGLKPGEAIVVNGLQRVRPGEPITPQKVAMIEPDKAAGASSAEADQQPEPALEKKPVKELSPQDKSAADKPGQSPARRKVAVR